jgi:hypothetical protein
VAETPSNPTTAQFFRLKFAEQNRTFIDNFAPDFRTYIVASANAEMNYTNSATTALATAFVANNTAFYSDRVTSWQSLNAIVTPSIPDAVDLMALTSNVDKSFAIAIALAIR